MRGRKQNRLRKRRKILRGGDAALDPGHAVLMCREFGMEEMKCGIDKDGRGLSKVKSVMPGERSAKCEKSNELRRDKKK